MSELDSAKTVTVKNGKLITSRVIDKVSSKIEKGALIYVSAIIIHQTGSSTAKSSLSSYDDGSAGAHFLIDKDGTIFQTARIDQKCWHVGNIRSRCQSMTNCSEDELKKVESILFKKGESYAVRVKSLSKYESAKSYPERYPTNEDSIGIEIVGSFDAKGGSYETVTKQQNESLSWLIVALQTILGITNEDVYRHPEISYKQASEAASAKWR